MNGHCIRALFRHSRPSATYHPRRYITGHQSDIACQIETRQIETCQIEACQIEACPIESELKHVITQILRYFSIQHN